MIDYRAGSWGFHVACGIKGSLGPRALAVAVPNALITLGVCYMFKDVAPDEDEAKKAELIIEAATVVMIFILYNRSRTSYNRWWEGGTLLQKTRGEWFNAYSSIMAFTSAKPELQHKVMEYSHLVARLMSLLMCCGLQQVSPNRDRPFELIDPVGIDCECLDFLNQAPDKVEILLQWLQRSMVDQMQTGVLPVAPPILSRAFQEFSRGIVNLQNARKIADFPYPYPLAQMSMILQLVHWAVTPFYAAFAFRMPTAIIFSFVSIFALWGIHFNALDLEFPFGDRINDLPMVEFQRDWNNSVASLLMDKARNTPSFAYDSGQHDSLMTLMSDGTDLPTTYMPAQQARRPRVSEIKVRRSTHTEASSVRNSISSIPGPRTSTSALPSVQECSCRDGLRDGIPEMDVADVASERGAPPSQGQQHDASGEEVKQQDTCVSRPPLKSLGQRVQGTWKASIAFSGRPSAMTKPTTEVLDSSGSSAPGLTGLSAI